MARTVAWIVAFLVLLSIPPAEAHKLKIFATAIGSRIDGAVYFVGGDPAGDAEIKVETPAGKLLARLRADDQGRFSMTAEARVDHVLMVNLSDGHVARFTIPAAALPMAEGAGVPAPQPEPPRPPSQALPDDRQAIQAMVELAVARQIRPLREQLNAYEDQLRLRDVLGGLSFILGLAGLTLWLKARNGARPGR